MRPFEMLVILPGMFTTDKHEPAHKANEAESGVYLRPRTTECFKMHWIGWIVIVLALLEGGWLAFDGAHAFVTGDYITPESGSYAGQLGPWATLCNGMGIDPHSTLVKAVHVGLGSLWLLVVLCFAFRLSWAWTGMLTCAIAGLWYLPFGTLLSVVQIALLFLPPVRQAFETSP